MSTELSRFPPTCLCPMNRFGVRCFIEHDACRSSPCLNGGSCLPDSQPDRVICLCTKDYRGPRCQSKRPSIHLSVSSNVSYRCVVIQFLQIDFNSLDLILLDQRVFRRFPDQIEYYHQRLTNTIPDIVLAKRYSSDQDSMPDVYLLSVHLNLFSFAARTEISPHTRCEHIRTFSTGNRHSF